MIVKGIDGEGERQVRKGKGNGSTAGIYSQFQVYDICKNQIMADAPPGDIKGIDDFVNKLW